jgi:hypothetical protein
MRVRAAIPTIARWTTRSRGLRSETSGRVELDADRCRSTGYRVLGAFLLSADSVKSAHCRV